MAKTIEQLGQLISPAIEALGFELYGCEFHSHMNHSVLIVYVDGPQGVTLGDCSKVSRQISAILDVEDPINGRYELEVSSPGIDRPLFYPRHYERIVGKKVKLRLRQPRNSQRNFLGILQAATHEHIVLLLDDKSELLVTFADIEKAKLISDL